MLTALSACGTFIGNPDRISADGPGKKDKREESLDAPNTNTSNEGIVDGSVSSDVDGDEIIYEDSMAGGDQMDSIEPEARTTADQAEPSAAIAERMSKALLGPINTQESNRQALPLTASTSAVFELKEYLAAKMEPPALPSEDFVDYFSDFPKESFEEAFKVSYHMSTSLWDANTYLLSIVIDASILTDTPYMDVKSFIEFNPAVVSQFRLIGYENELGLIIDDKLSLSQFNRGDRKTLAFEVVLNSETQASDADLFKLNLSYLKPNEADQLMSNSATVSHDLSGLVDAPSDAQVLMNASVALSRALNGDIANRAQALTEAQSFLQANRAAEPSAKWLELEGIINELLNP